MNKLISRLFFFRLCSSSIGAAGGQYCRGRYLAGGPHNTTPRVRSRSTQQQPGHGSAGARSAGARTEREQSVQRHGAVEDVLAHEISNNLRCNTGVYYINYNIYK